MSASLEYLIFPFYQWLLCVSLPFIQRNDRNLSSFVPQTGGNVETFLSTLKTLMLKVSLLSITVLHKLIIREILFDMVYCWAGSVQHDVLRCFEYFKSSYCWSKGDRKSNISTRGISNKIQEKCWIIWSVFVNKIKSKGNLILKLIT